MSRTPFMLIFFVLIYGKTGCKSMPANFNRLQHVDIQQQQHNGDQVQPYGQTGDVPFGQGNPLPYSPVMLIER